MTVAHRVRKTLAAPFARQPQLIQWLRWPRFWSAPYRQRELNLVRTGELGDVLMCLAVVRAIRERNPAARITFVTHYTALLAGHPLLDRVLTPTEAQAERLAPLIELRYEVFIPLRRHAIDYLAGCVGLRGVAPVIPLPDFSGELGPLADLLRTIRPRVMLCRQAGAFTPNKAWPEARWDELVERLLERADVFELGAEAPPQPLRPRPGHVDLRGRTSMRQFGALIARADLVISLASSAAHFAAAYGVPAVRLVSGFELPGTAAYPGQISLHHAVACAPCWLRTPCPHDRKCMAGIGVEAVVAAAADLCPGLRDLARARQPAP